MILRDIAVSAVVMHELYYGNSKSKMGVANAAVIDSLNFRVLEFDRDDARHAGEVRASLAGGGASVGLLDVLIAGQARARD